MKTLIIGANGKVGRLTCRRCAEVGLDSVAMIRDPGQQPFFADLNLPTVVADLEEKDFAYAFDGCDRVVFTAGSGGGTGGNKTILVDLYGCMRAADIAQRRGVKHFILVSAIMPVEEDREGNPIDEPLNGPDSIKHYLVAKKLADEYVLRLELPCTILRPGKLSDEAPSGKLHIASQRDDGPKRRTVSRANVAQAIVTCLQNDRPLNRTISFRDGDTPIAEIFG